MQRDVVQPARRQAVGGTGVVRAGAVGRADGQAGGRVMVAEGIAALPFSGDQMPGI